MGLLSGYAERALTELLGHDSGNLVGRQPVGAWTTFVSTASPATGSITSQTSNSAYLLIGKIIFCSIHVTITNVGTGSGAVTITLPVTPKRDGDFLPGRERGTSGKMISSVMSGGSTTATLFNYDNTNVSLATGSVYDFTGVYEAL